MLFEESIIVYRAWHGLGLNKPQHGFDGFRSLRHSLRPVLLVGGSAASAHWGQPHWVLPAWARIFSLASRHGSLDHSANSFLPL